MLATELQHGPGTLALRDIKWNEGAHPYTVNYSLQAHCKWHRQWESRRHSSLTEWLSNGIDLSARTTEPQQESSTATCYHVDWLQKHPAKVKDVSQRFMVTRILFLWTVQNRWSSKDRQQQVGCLWRQRLQETESDYESKFIWGT